MKQPEKKIKREADVRRSARKITQGLDALSLADVEALRQLSDEQRHRLRVLYVIMRTLQSYTYLSTCDLTIYIAGAMTAEEGHNFFDSVLHALTPVLRPYCSLLSNEVRTEELAKCEQAWKDQGLHVADLLRPRPELEPFLVSLGVISATVCAEIVSYC